MAAKKSEPKSNQRKHKISSVKIKSVEDLKKLIKESKTILIASIKNLPAAKFQDIGKKLRGTAVVKVPKKKLMKRAIDESGNKGLEELKKYVEDSTAVLFSDIESYELAGELLRNKSPAKAKPGQEAPEDIEVQEGPTDLVPGPAVSELGALGIEIKIDKGKIVIARTKVIVKKGGKITQAQADVMSKLGIQPFSIGFTPLSAFDLSEGKLYLEMKIDSKKAVDDLKQAFGRALPFAVSIGYATPDIIKFILAKANSHEKAIASLLEKNESQTPEELNSNGEETK